MHATVVAVLRGAQEAVLALLAQEVVPALLAQEAVPARQEVLPALDLSLQSPQSPQSPQNPQSLRQAANGVKMIVNVLQLNWFNVYH